MYKGPSTNSRVLDFKKGRSTWLGKKIHQFENRLATIFIHNCVRGWLHSFFVISVITKLYIGWCNSSNFSFIMYCYEQTSLLYLRSTPKTV